MNDPWLDMDLTEKTKAEKAIESALPSAPPPVETNEAAETPKTSLGAAAAVKEVTYSPDDTKCIPEVICVDKSIKPENLIPITSEVDCQLMWFQASGYMC